MLHGKIISACKAGDLNKLNRHLRKAINIDFIDEKDNTPLSAAFCENHLAIAERLLSDSRTDVNKVCPAFIQNMTVHDCSLGLQQKCRRFSQSFARKKGRSWDKN